MPKEIKIFKTFEEQELYQLQQMANKTPLERFYILKKMQDFFYKIDSNEKRKIVITQSTKPNGFTQR